MKTEDLAFKLNRIENVYNSSTVKQTVGWGLLKSKAPESWHLSQGEGCNVMVIDTGRPSHIDLEYPREDIIAEDKIIIHKNAPDTNLDKNFVESEGIEDLNGHQTHCSGIICARNNNIGMVGIAPKAKLISVKALDRYGRGNVEAMVRSLEYALDIRPDVISLSVGFTRPFGKIHELIKKLYQMKIPVVCAAGNGGEKQGVLWPAVYPETIAVGAYAPRGSVPKFSAKGDSLDFSAPGVKIMSTWLDNKYAELSGTSMACPFIAGIVALIKSKHKLLEKNGIDDNIQSVDDIKKALISCSNDRGAIGKDNEWGYGVINFQKLNKLL